MPRSSSRQGPVRKPRADIFTVLLILALVALITACAFVYIDISRYEASAAPLGPAHSIVNTAVAVATPVNLTETGSRILVTSLT